MGCSHRLWFAGNRQEKFELGWELVLGIQSVGEIDSTDAAVCMNLNSKRLDVVGTVSSAREIRQVELDLAWVLALSQQVRLLLDVDTLATRLHLCPTILLYSYEPIH